MNRLSGMWVPLPTPVRNGNEIDREGLAKTVQQVQSHADGLIVGLGTGMGDFLDASSLNGLVRLVREKSGAVPVAMGIMGNRSDAEIIQCAGSAAANGCDFIIMAGPKGTNDEEVCQNLSAFQKLLKALPREMPVVVYNRMRVCQMQSLETVQKVIAACRPGQIIGIKEGTDNEELFKALLDCDELKASGVTVAQGSGYLLGLKSSGGCMAECSMAPESVVVPRAVKTMLIDPDPQALSEIMNAVKAYNLDGAYPDFVRGVHRALCEQGVLKSSDILPTASGTIKLTGLQLG